MYEFHTGRHHWCQPHHHDGRHGEYVLLCSVRGLSYRVHGVYGGLFVLLIIGLDRIWQASSDVGIRYICERCVRQLVGVVDEF